MLTLIPFGKLQEGNHLLRGVDLSQWVVWVHQYNSSDDNPLKEKASEVKEIYSSRAVFMEIRQKKKSWPKRGIPEVFINSELGRSITGVLVLNIH